MIVLGGRARAETAQLRVVALDGSVLRRHRRSAFAKRSTGGCGAELPEWSHCRGMPGDRSGVPYCCVIKGHVANGCVEPKGAMQYSDVRRWERFRSRRAIPILLSTRLAAVSISVPQSSGVLGSGLHSVDVQGRLCVVHGLIRTKHGSRSGRKYCPACVQTSALARTQPSTCTCIIACTRA